MNESLIKYLAGLLDADGSLSFQFKEDTNRKGIFFVGMLLKLSSSEAVDRNSFVSSLPELTGMGRVYGEARNPLFKSWYVTKRADLEMLLPRLVKHMVVKGKHWDWMLNQWRELRANSKAATADQMEALRQLAKQSRIENAGPLKPKNHPTWAWLAGYLDGDGWYTYRKNKSANGFSWHINVGAVAHLNDICVLDFLQNAFGGEIFEHGQGKDVRIWRRSLGYQNRDFALRFLPKVVKHSRLKRHKIETIIHHHRQRLSVQGVKAQATV